MQVRVVLAFSSFTPLLYPNHPLPVVITTLTATMTITGNKPQKNSQNYLAPITSKASVML